MRVSGWTWSGDVFCRKGQTAIYSLLNLITEESVSYSSGPFSEIEYLYYTDPNRIKTETIIEFAEFMLKNGAIIPKDILVPLRQYSIFQIQLILQA